MAAESPAKKARIDMAATASGGSALTTWVDMPADCDWTIHNIPFGVFTPEGGDGPRIGTAIGTKVSGCA